MNNTEIATKGNTFHIPVLDGCLGPSRAREPVALVRLARRIFTTLVFVIYVDNSFKIERVLKKK